MTRQNYPSNSGDPTFNNAIYLVFKVFSTIFDQKFKARQKPHF